MGDIADMVLEGTLCDQCGAYIEGEEAPGYPRTCDDCKAEDKEDANNKS